MVRRRTSSSRARVQLDEAELAAFRAGLRRRYSDSDILDELRAAAKRLGRSPTMREFAQDPEAQLHPQTVIEHFGTWNAAKRAAGSASGPRVGPPPHPEGERSGSTTRVAPLGISLRAHVRLFLERVARGRLRRTERGGA